MGQTTRRFPVFEIAISLEDCAPNPNERKLVGDIIGVRNPHFCIGFGEMKTYLWLRLEGLEENETCLLSRPLYQNEDILFHGLEYDKRRFCIPLMRLKEVVPSFDIAKTLDLNLIYQPFLSVDEDTGYYTAQELPLSVHGLVYDKRKGEYL